MYRHMILPYFFIFNFRPTLASKLYRMKKSVKIVLISLGIIVAGVAGYFIVSSLSSNDSADICNGEVLFPFQEKEDGDWGFIDIQGNEIISPEFKERPSLAKNGIFLLEQTKKDKKFYQFYRISDNKAKEIGDRWDTAHEFSDGLAAVVQENKYIQFINEDMKVVFTLDKMEKAGNFLDGMVRIQNPEGEWGYANKEGKIVIKPSYERVSDFYDGKAVVAEVKGKENEEKSMYFYVIDKNGEKLLNLKDKYANVENATEGYFKVTEIHDDEVEYGFIDINGEKVVKPKDYQNITTVHNGHFSYQEEGEWGLKNTKGEKILGAKYAEPLFVFNDIVWFKKEGEEDYGAMNLEGEEVIEEEYSNVFPFYCNTTFARDGKDFIFIDKEGETINKMEYRNIKTEWESLIHPIYNSFTSYTNYDITSDYFDVSAYTEQVNIGEITRILGKGVTSTKNYFGGNDDSNKKALIDNSSRGYHSSTGIGEYNYYNGGYPRYKLYWSKSDMRFTWKEHKESNGQPKSSQSFSPLELKDKNITNIVVYANFNDYLKTKTVSKSQASRISNRDIEGMVRTNSSAKLNEINITINVQNKGYGKTDKIAEAFGSELKKLIDIDNEKFKETKADGSYYLYGTSDKMSAKVTASYSSVTIKLTKIDREDQNEMDASSVGTEEVTEEVAW